MENIGEVGGYENKEEEAAQRSLQRKLLKDEKYDSIRYEKDEWNKENIYFFDS
jgi:hypothetical protein